MNISFLVVKHLMLGGGIEKYTREVASRLVRRGHTVTVYSMKHHGPALITSEGIRIVHVPCLQRSSTEKITAGAAAALIELFRRDGADVVHLHSVAIGAFAWLFKLRGISTVLQMHGVEWQRSRWSNFGRGTLKFLEKLSISHAGALTAVSKTQCEFYKREYGIQMSYIPTGADLKDSPPALEIYKLGLQPDKYILFASRLVREKGAHYLISAYKQLDTDCYLVIAGNAKGEEEYKDELRVLADNNPRILFPGFVQGRLIDELFSHARLYVQPSEIEGLSIALLEAMSYSNACLVSDIPENREAIGDAGLTFQSKNVEDLTKQIQKALSDPKKLIETGKLARIRVCDFYSWDTITDQLEAAYEECRK
ncbi:MAG: glycosyltransferase family 4 protein [Chlorobiaceae bacterium]|nr:glycosyltransferase family 4 protein [Chlorobiaceae bacterium]